MAAHSGPVGAVDGPVLYANAETVPGTLRRICAPPTFVAAGRGRGVEGGFVDDAGFCVEACGECAGGSVEGGDVDDGLMVGGVVGDGAGEGGGVGVLEHCDEFGAGVRREAHGVRVRGAGAHHVGVDAGGVACLSAPNDRYVVVGCRRRIVMDVLGMAAWLVAVAGSVLT